MTTIDLRSDTVTRPSPGMREAMARAEVGRRRLRRGPDRQRASRSAWPRCSARRPRLFVPSGTMANQIALGVLARAGEEVLCHEGAHLLNFEGGAAAALWGVQLRPLPGARGILSPADGRGRHPPRGRLAPAHAGGRPSRTPTTAPAAPSGRWTRCASRRRAGRGAAASPSTSTAPGSSTPAPRPGSPRSDYAAPATLASICLSKGLGAPAGSLLAGPAELIARRPAGSASGSAAACARPASWPPPASTRSTTTSPGSPRTTPTRAASAAGLGPASGWKVAFPPETNLVYFRVPAHGPAAAERLRARRRALLARRPRQPAVRRPTSTSAPPTWRRPSAGWRPRPPEARTSHTQGTGALPRPLAAPPGRCYRTPRFMPT